MVSKPDDHSIKSTYFRLSRRRLALGAVMAALTIVLCAVSLSAGSASLGFVDAVKCLFGGPCERGAGYIIWNIRLPRTLIAATAGASLASAGCVAQNVLGNPLATPFTIGISQGAAFGASAAIIFFGAGGAGPPDTAVKTFAGAPYFVALCAFSGSLVCVFFILTLSTVVRMKPEGLILAGVALSSFFGALTMLVQYFATDFQTAAAVFWSFGDPGRAGWNELALMASVLIFSLSFFMYNAWNYNALECGDETAASLGVRARRLRSSSLVVSSMLAAVTTAFLGVIGFIGIIAPQILKFPLGNDHRYLIPFSAVLGAFILLAADLIGRTAVQPLVLPVGILTAFAGAPLFLYILVRNARR